MSNNTHQKNLSFSIFPSDDPNRTEKSPDYTGYIIINNMRYNLWGYVRNSSRGQFISGFMLTPKPEYQGQQGQQQPTQQPAQQTSSLPQPAPRSQPQNQMAQTPTPTPAPVQNTTATSAPAQGVSAHSGQNYTPRNQNIDPNNIPLGDLPNGQEQDVPF